MTYIDTSAFADFGLDDAIVRALARSGYDTPTPIQRDAIPPLMTGRDLCGIAQTGTGKTAAFLLPSLHHLLTKPAARPTRGCRMLILSPTRELAAQIGEKARDYGRFTGLSVLTIFGGVPIFSQKKKLAHGVDILVATPGRLLDLVDQNAFFLDEVEIFVLDEADQMMDLGFIHPLKRIDALLPKERQSLFFSATMPKAIAELGARFLNNPVRVSVTPQATTAERVEQYATFVDQREKQALLNIRLKDGSVERALVFTRTKHGADRVVRHLAAAGIRSAAIHGNKSQAQRTGALQAFRNGEMRVLVATDIAARGIDVPGVSHVFNFELPNVAEQYVHRIGRTARAGAEGIAVSFVANDERGYLKDIERLTRVRLMPLGLPEGFRAAVEAMPKVAPPTREEMQADERRASAARGRGGRPMRGARPHGAPSFGDAPRGDGERGYGRGPDRNYGRPMERRSEAGGFGRHAENGAAAPERADHVPAGHRRDNRSHIRDDRVRDDRTGRPARPARQAYRPDFRSDDRPQSRDHRAAPSRDGFARREGRDEPRGDRAPRHADGDGQDNRRHQHRRGGPAIAGAYQGRDGEKPRNYGPRGGNGVGKYKKRVKRVP